jgi:RNA-directed DNA polymerase
MEQGVWKQLTFAFVDNIPKGVSGKERLRGVSRKKPTTLPKADVMELNLTTTARTDKLLEAIASDYVLIQAMRNVIRNKGAAGEDGQKVDEFAKNMNTILPELQKALLSETYQPGDIRRVWIPKPGGGERGLGIPNIIDRVVQEAVNIVLTPIYDPSFHNSSHGFRPKRGAQTAVTEARKHIEDGYNIVVDIDLSKFFDRVNHQRLLGRLSQKIQDMRVLRLISKMLKVHVVMPDGVKVLVEEGTPQGGPLSPLLSNIVLDELDNELERRGLKFVRYADDCNIYVGSIRAGKRVFEATRRFIENRLKLKVNEEKSWIRKTDEGHFLGFRLPQKEDGTTEVLLSERTHKRICTRIRELTPRTWGSPLHMCIGKLNSYLRGWAGYFKLCTPEVIRMLEIYEAHIRRRLRAIIVQMKKKPKNLCRHLIARGVKNASARKAAYSGRGVWYKSNTRVMCMAYPNAWFEERLVSLVELFFPYYLAAESGRLKF